MALQAVFPAVASVRERICSIPKPCMCMMCQRAELSHVCSLLRVNSSAGGPHDFNITSVGWSCATGILPLLERSKGGLGWEGGCGPWDCTAVGKEVPSRPLFCRLGCKYGPGMELEPWMPG